MKRAVVNLEVLVTVTAPDDVIARLDDADIYENETELWRDLAVSCIKDCEVYHGPDPKDAEAEYPDGWVQIEGEAVGEELYEGPEDV